MKRKAILYTRVSSEEQKERGYSLIDQERRLREYCQHNDLIVEAHFQDDHSAKDFNRPSFQKMIVALRIKELQADLFVCVRMDRFSRNISESLNMIKRLEEFGLEFRLLENNYDLKVPENLIPHVLTMALAQVENERRSLNTKSGMRQAMREGRWMGGAPKGYRYVQSGTKSNIIPNADAIFIENAFEEFSKGIYLVEELRRHLNKEGFKCSKSQFPNILRNLAYMGKILIPAWRDEPEEIVEGLHSPIVSEDLFYMVQSILKNRKKQIRVRNKKDEKLPLRGFLKCGKCGRNLTGSASTGRSGARHYYYHCQRNQGCGERFKAKDANDIFIQYLASFQVPSEVLSLYFYIIRDLFEKGILQKTEKTKQISRQIERLQEMIINVEDKFISDAIDKPTYNKARQRYHDEISDLQSLKQSLELHDSQYSEYVNYGFSLIQNLSEYFIQSEIRVKQKIIGSIFPHKLIFNGKNYRTTQINKGIALLASNINEFGKIVKRNTSKNPGTSGGVPPAGIEPARMAPEAIALSTELRGQFTVANI